MLPSFAEMLNRGKREVGELAYFGSEIEEVMSDWCSLRNIHLSQTRSALCGGGMFLRVKSRLWTH